MVTNGATLNKQEVSWDEALGGPLPDTSHQQRLQQTVATVAATMDAPPYNTPREKLQKAMDLVLENKVQAHVDGLYTVQGSTKTYDIGSDCPCPQGQRQKSKWCQHMVAVELWKRVQMRLYPSNGSNGQTWVDTAMQNPHVNGAAYQSPESDYPAASHLEDWHKPAHHWTDVLAPICHTVKYVVDGVEHCTVLRGDDMDEVMTQVKELTAVVKKGRESETIPTEDIPYCDTHKVHFQRHSNDKGSWFSHKTADGWCRYRD